MRAEGFTSFVTVEERRKNTQRQRRRDKKRIALQGRDNYVAQLPRLRAGVSKLVIVFNNFRLVTRGDAAIHPGRPIHYLTAMGDLFLAENVGNVDNHRFVSVRI